MVWMTVRFCVAAEMKPAELKEISEKWSGTTSLMYEERGTFVGDTWLRVDGSGRAVVARAKLGVPDKEIPAGIYVATLSAKELAELAGILRKHDFTKRQGLTLATDGIEVTTAVSVDGVRMTSRLEEGTDTRDAELEDLREGMRKIIVRVVRESGQLTVKEVLKTWVEGAEVVEMRFTGPHEEPVKLGESLTVERSWESGFMFTPGETGGRSVLTVCMKVTPENVEKLQALWAELGRRKFELDGRTLQVWSYVSNAAVREKARKMIPELVAAAEKGVKGAAPEAKWKEERLDRRGLVNVSVTGEKLYGRLRITEITMEKSWILSRDLRMGYDDFYLPHVGLMVEIWHLPDGTAGNVGVRKALREAIEPLVKIEEESR
jgi:hypothetical protein